MKNKKGFTLAELLVVVAIIAVLVAITIPFFSTKLHDAKVATDWANLRTFYAEIRTDEIETGDLSFLNNYPKSYGSMYGPDAKFIPGKNHPYTKLVGGKIQTWIRYGTNGYMLIYICDKNCENHKVTITRFPNSNRDTVKWGTN